LSNDDLVHPEFYHQTSPRKWRSYTSAATYSPSIYNKCGNGCKQPELTPMEHSWIGKKILYWTGDSISSYVKQVRETKYGKNSIGEYEIAKYARPNIYRILFLDQDGKIKSKPEVSYRPGRMNILVDTNDIIRGVLYF